MSSGNKNNYLNPVQQDGSSLKISEPGSKTWLFNYVTIFLCTKNNLLWLHYKHARNIIYLFYLFKSW